MDARVEEYIVDLVRATREPERVGLGHRAALIEYGASPRAAIFLARASKAYAYIRHRAYVVPEDVLSVAMDALRHRLIPSYEAEAEEGTNEDLIAEVLSAVRVP